MRNLKMYCVEISNDRSEFELRFEVDGEVVNSKIEYSFDDILYDSYKFFKECCEKINFDSRFDKFEINLEYKY